jgi:hypothetical protein
MLVYYVSIRSSGDQVIFSPSTHPSVRFPVSANGKKNTEGL